MTEYEDTRTVALELNFIRNTQPYAYHYIKGYIHHAIDKQASMVQNKQKKETKSTTESQEK